MYTGRILMKRTHVCAAQKAELRLSFRSRVVCVIILTAAIFYVKNVIL